MYRSITQCAAFPCKVEVVLSQASSPSRFVLATPFIMADIIAFVSILSTNAVLKRAKQRFAERAGDRPVDPDLHHSTYALALPWVVDTAQIPALFGIPLAGIAILRDAYGASFLIGYTVALVAVIAVFLHFLDEVPIFDYEQSGRQIWKYKVTSLTMAGLTVNGLGALAAAILR
jgi:hypothetical protein